MTGVLARSITTGRWDVLNSLSSAEFAVRNLAVKTVRGCIPIREASVEVDSSGHATSVQAVLDLAGIDTGNARRDRDLAKPHLLATEQYPTLTFHAGRAETDADGWKLVGRLDAHGTSTEVLLDVRVIGGVDPGRIAVRATTSFDRRELGIRVPRFFIGRRITVTIDAILRRPVG